MGEIARKMFELTFIVEGSDLTYKRNGWYEVWKSGYEFEVKDPKISE